MCEGMISYIDNIEKVNEAVIEAEQSKSNVTFHSSPYRRPKSPQLKKPKSPHSPTKRPPSPTYSISSSSSTATKRSFDHPAPPAKKQRTHTPSPSTTTINEFDFPTVVPPIDPSNYNDP